MTKRHNKSFCRTTLENPGGKASDICTQIDCHTKAVTRIDLSESESELELDMHHSDEEAQQSFLQDALEDLGGEASDMSSSDEKEATKHSKENFKRSRGGASDMNQSDRPNTSPSKKKIRFETRSVNDEKHREWEKTRQAFYTSSPYW